MIEQVRLLRRVVVVWLLLLTLLLLSGGLVADYRSCQRQIPVRTASAARAHQLQQAWRADANRALADARIDPNAQGAKVAEAYAKQRRYLAEHIAQVRPIDCSTFPPGR